MNEHRLSYCETCKNTPDNYNDGYIWYMIDDNDICPHCGSKVVKLPISNNEYLYISHISKEPEFINAMIKLKEENIIEFSSRIAQFRTQKEEAIRREDEQKKQQSNQPKCPHCSSTKIAKISGTERAGSILMWGIFSKKINKSFKCNSCDYTW